MTRISLTRILKMYNFEVLEIDDDIEFWTKKGLVVIANYRKKKLAIAVIRNNEIVSAQHYTMYKDVPDFLKKIIEYI